MQHTSKTVLVLGANGRFGSHATGAFAKAGWRVLAQTRPNSSLSVAQDLGSPLDDTLTKAIHHYAIGLNDHNALIAQARKCSVIVNALNPRFGQWDTQVPIMTQLVLELAKASGATLIVPGNVYIFGNSMPENLTQNTSHRPSNSMGVLRTNMELSFRAASQDGHQVIILRGGDFLQAQDGGNWFDSHLSKSLQKGKLAYPGRTNIIHAWCYLPDFCRACAELAEIRDSLPVFNDIPYEGTTLTARQLKDQIAKALKHDVRLNTFPWWIIRLLSLLNKDLKGVLKMRYLWDTPHKLDGTAFRRLLPNFRETSTEDIIADCVRRYQ